MVSLPTFYVFFIRVRTYSNEGGYGKCVRLHTQGEERSKIIEILRIVGRGKNGKGKIAGQL